MRTMKPLTLVIAAAFFALAALPTAIAKTTTVKSDREIRRKLKTIMLPRIAFEDTPVSTVFAYLKQRSRELDPQGVGVNFVLILKPAERTQTVKKTAKEKEDDDEGFGDDATFDDEDEQEEKEWKPIVRKPKEPTITVDFNNIPLGDAIRYICSIAKMRYKVENHAVVILGQGVTQSNLEFRVFSVDPRMFRNIKDEDIKKFFEDKGVSFPTSTKR